MKKLIISSLVLAVMLLFVSWSFAGWNEGGFKNSPLFKHSLNEAVTNMENQGKQVASEGENMDTSSPKCYSPNAPFTSGGQPTCDETCYPTVCGGECYTSQYTCGVTVCDNTCQSTCQTTCGSQPTCESTCESTCQSTCQNTCSNCPPAVEGTVSHNYWGYFTNNWGPYSSNRVVKQMAYPYKHVNFNRDNGYYFCDKWGQPAQQL